MRETHKERKTKQKQTKQILGMTYLLPIFNPLASSAETQIKDEKKHTEKNRSYPLDTLTHTHSHEEKSITNTQTLTHKRRRKSF